MSAQIDEHKMLQDHVDHIAHDLQHGALCETCPDCDDDIVDGKCKLCGRPADMDGFTYLQDALDIQYLVTGDKQYIAARILVAFGGPNIWINTNTKTVEGHWWGDSAFARYYDDPMDIDGACEELWSCA